MNRRESLAQRREILLARIGVQRTMLIAQKRSMQEAVMPSHMAAGLLASVRQNKWLLAGAALTVFVLKPKRIVAGMSTLLVGWEAWNSVKPVLRNVMNLCKRSS